MVLGVNGMGSVSSLYGKKDTSRKHLNKNEFGSNAKKSYSVFLNRAFSKDVVNYAHNIYRNVIALKDSSRELKEFVEEYKTVEDRIDSLDDKKKEKIVDIFQQKVQKFVDDYDKAFEFADNQKENSKVLKEFSNALHEIGGNQEEILEKLEVNESEEGILDVGIEIKDFEQKQGVKDKLENAKQVVEGLSSAIENILTKPMAEHMNFRSLNYYYNYKLDTYKANSFTLIEAGLIVDLTL